VDAVSEAPNVRLVDGRRMQCKDIPDEVFLDAVRCTLPPWPTNTGAAPWRMKWDVQATLEAQLGPVPERLFLAKVNKLITAWRLGGCACGCRGDYHLPDECEASHCCHPE
jgi:hypothetical protein